MLIGIDGNEANIIKRVGIGQYAFQLLTHIQKLDHQNRYIVYLKQPPLPDMPPPSDNWKYIVFGPQKFWTRLALPLKLFFHQPRPDLFFSPSHYIPFFSPVPAICSIMDLGYLHYSSQFTQKDLYQLTNWTKESIVKSKHIITISRFTKKEIENIYHTNSHKITIAYPGVEAPINIPTDNNLPKDYFLSLGTLKPSKNIPFLIDAFAKFSQKHSNFHLIIAGKKGWLFDEIFNTVKKHNLENKIIFQDYISDNQKWSLLRQAKSLIIPSHYEGFGIPAIEAMAVGTPVISSNIASLPEIVTGCGLLIDPNQVDSLVDAMNQIIKPTTRSKFIKLGAIQAKKFTWDNAAKVVIQLFNSTN